MTNVPQEQLKAGRTFTIYNVQGGTVLDNDQWWGAKKVHAWQNLSNKNQQWTIHKRPNADLIILKNAQSGRYLVPTGSHNGALIQCGDRPYAWRLREGAVEGSVGLEMTDAPTTFLCNAYGYSRNGNTIWSWKWAPQFHKMMSWQFRVPAGLEGQMEEEKKSQEASVASPQGKGDAAKEAEVGRGAPGDSQEDNEDLKRRLADAEKAAEEARAATAKVDEEMEVMKKENEAMKKEMEAMKKENEDFKQRASSAEAQAAESAQRLEEERTKAEEVRKDLDRERERAREMEKEKESAKQRQRELEAELEESQRQVEGAGTVVGGVGADGGQSDGQEEKEAQRQRQEELDEWELALRRRARELTAREEKAAVAAAAQSRGDSGKGNGSARGSGTSGSASAASAPATDANGANARVRQLQEENARLRKHLRDAQEHDVPKPTFDGPGAEATAQRWANERSESMKDGGTKGPHKGENLFCWSAHDSHEFTFLPRLSGVGRTNARR